MNTGFQIRFYKNTDLAEMLAIYKPYVISTGVSFEYEVPAEEEFAGRISDIALHYPCLVCEQDEKIAGYCYSGIHRVRSAYQWSTESTIYMADEYHGKGMAQVLYQTLLSVLKLQGFINVYAGITLPNPKSEKFHLKCGFSEVAVFEKMGYKAGQWYDLKFFELTLSKHAENPMPPVAITTLKESNALIKILDDVNYSRLDSKPG